jgi:hypothetical protein
MNKATDWYSSEVNYGNLNGVVTLFNDACVSELFILHWLGYKCQQSRYMLCFHDLLFFGILTKRVYVDI